MPERDELARTLYEAATAKARAERANVVPWEGVSDHFRNGYLTMADGAIAAGWSRDSGLFALTDIEASR